MLAYIVNQFFFINSTLQFKVDFLDLGILSVICLDSSINVKYPTQIFCYSPNILFHVFTKRIFDVF